MASSRIAGRKLRELRINRGLSPEQLGAKVGVSGHTIRRVEQGSHAMPRTMFLIAREFDLLPTDIWPLRNETGALR